MSRSPQEAPQRSSEHIDQIRDIILGPQKRETDTRFEQLSADLRREQERIDARVDELRAFLKASEAGLQKTIKESRAELESTVAATVREMELMQARLRQELAEVEARFQSDLRQTRERYAAELERNIALLRDASVSREMLVGLLQELAVKVRGGDMLEELKSVMRAGSAE